MHPLLRKYKAQQVAIAAWDTKLRQLQKQLEEAEKALEDQKSKVPQLSELICEALDAHGITDYTLYGKKYSSLSDNVLTWLVSIGGVRCEVTLELHIGVLLIDGNTPAAALQFELN